MADVALVAGGVEDAPLGYTIPGAQEIIPKAITATYDGSGAGGDFVPTLVIRAPNGQALSRCPIGTTLTAGASADVSWFPRGGVTTGSGPPPFVVTQEVVGNAGDITVAANNTNVWSLSHSSGAHFLEYSTPTNPTFIVGGIFIVYAILGVHVGPTPANVYYIRPVVTQIAGLGVGSTTPVEGGSLGGPSSSVTTFCKRAHVGDSALVGLGNDAAVSHSFFLSDYIITRIAA